MKIGRVIGDLATRMPLVGRRVQRLRQQLRNVHAAPSQGELVASLPVAAYLPSQAAPWPCPAGLAVAVVIPVYRGLAETRRCLDSVLAGRGEPVREIIVVDDCSPEPELSEWLVGLADAGVITLLRNATNLGFVASVNRGIAAAGRRDVVLLNADTEVPAGWLARLAGHASSSPRIGTVTPFSNNATICSWPAVGGGPLPPGRTVASMDAAFRAANSGRQVDLPTAVGYCMYIRRECLDAVGGFDEATFGRGYGEENDFCLRATAAGWRHVLACDTFVFHVGETSFGHDSPERARAWSLLTARYPDYAASVARHVEADPAASSRFTATAALFRQATEPTLLVITHALGGGTERHIRDLLSSIGSRANVLRLEPRPGGLALSVPALPGHPEATFQASRVDDLVAVLRSCGVARVHVHHWLGYEIQLRSLLDRLGVPFDVTIHDYFSLCPQINLLPTPASLFCGDPDAATCNSCIAGRPQHGATDITTWRTRHGWLLQEAERVICPSQDTHDRIARVWPHARLLVGPHEANTRSSWTVGCTPPQPGQPLRIGVIGVLARHKGLDALAAAVEASDPREFEFVVIGSCDPKLPKHLRRRVHETGPYEEADLPRLLAAAQLHVAWFPALWPETYSYTLSAAIAADLPIVAPTIGAFPERLADRPLTRLMQPTRDGPTLLTAFAGLRSQLVAAPGPAAAPRRIDPVAFYPDGYLAPLVGSDRQHAEHRTSLRREGLTSVLVVPDRFADGTVSPCGAIRLVQPFDAMAAAHADICVEVVDLEAVLTRDADAIVCQRHVTADLASLERLVDHCRDRGIKLIYDLDDDLVWIPPHHPEAARLGALSPVVLRLLLAADAVWVATPALARRLSTIRPDAEVVRNRHDDRIWRLQSRTDVMPHRSVRIVYMGTATHDEELEFLEPVAESLQRLFGRRVSFDIVGVASRELAGCFQRVIPDEGPASQTYQGFVDWFRHQRWDIAVSPLLDSPFNRCKSAIKLLDYAALGLPVVASQQDEYRTAFGEDHGVTLVENTVAAWVEALSRLITDAAVRERDGGRIVDHYRRHHVWSAHLQALHDTLRRAVSLPARPSLPPILEFGTDDVAPEAAAPRRLVAAAYLAGSGIEIGALHNPLPLPAAARARYVDRLDTKGLYEHYPELRGFPLVDIDIIDDGERLTSIPDASQDFVIANHFLEHCEDPLTTLENLLRVVRSGGAIYMAVPDKRFTFDRDRAITPLAHLLDDRRCGPHHSRSQHFREWVTLVEPHFGRYGPGTPEAVITARMAELMSQRYSIHFHCWTSREVREMLTCARDVLAIHFDIEFFAEHPAEKENIFVLRKRAAAVSAAIPVASHRAVGLSGKVNEEFLGMRKQAVA
jgi:GT2 family glycosyltransferase/glycosyltransferase involved in cell wall biosynthesis